MDLADQDYLQFKFDFAEEDYFDRDRLVVMLSEFREELEQRRLRDRILFTQRMLSN